MSFLDHFDSKLALYVVVFVNSDFKSQCKTSLHVN